MERWFGVSYPTIKGRLNRVADRLDFAKVMEGKAPAARPADVLDRLEMGEINAEEALAELAP